MDFWLANTIQSVVGITAITFMISSVVRAVVNSPGRKAKAEIYRQERLAQLGGGSPSVQVESRLQELEDHVAWQTEEIKKLSEENEFFRRLLSDRAGKQDTAPEGNA